MGMARGSAGALFFRKSSIFVVNAPLRSCQIATLERFSPDEELCKSDHTTQSHRISGRFGFIRPARCAGRLAGLRRPWSGATARHFKAVSSTILISAHRSQCRVGSSKSISEYALRKRFVLFPDGPIGRHLRFPAGNPVQRYRCSPCFVDANITIMPICQATSARVATLAAARPRAGGPNP